MNKDRYLDLEGRGYARIYVYTLKLHFRNSQDLERKLGLDVLSDTTHPSKYGSSISAPSIPTSGQYKPKYVPPTHYEAPSGSPAVYVMSPIIYLAGPIATLDSKYGPMPKVNAR